MKSKFVLFLVLLSSVFVLTGCFYSSEYVDEKVRETYQTAYQEGFEEGYDSGYFDGYFDCYGGYDYNPDMPVMERLMQDDDLGDWLWQYAHPED